MQKDLYQTTLYWRFQKSMIKKEFYRQTEKEKTVAYKDTPLGNQQISQQKPYSLGDSEVMYLKY